MPNSIKYSIYNMIFTFNNIQQIKITNITYFLASLYFDYYILFILFIKYLRLGTSIDLYNKSIFFII